MRNASGHQCKEKMKKVNEKTYDISSIKKFLEVSRCSCVQWRQKNVPLREFVVQFKTRKNLRCTLKNAFVCF